MTDILWCCHIRGPDDVHAAPDYETAVKWCDIANAVNFSDPKRPPKSYEDCLIKAVPAIWPYSVEQHANDVKISTEDFKPRGVL